MSDSDQQSSPQCDERVWGLYIAIVFGSVFLLFLAGLFQYGDPEWTILTYGLALLFTAWSGSMTAGGIGKLLRRPWGERLVECCLGIAAVALFTGMVGSTCWEAYRRIVGYEPAEPGDGALLVLTLLWAGSVVLFSRDGSRDEPRRFEPVMILWPLLILLLNPSRSGCCSCPSCSSWWAATCWEASSAAHTSAHQSGSPVPSLSSQPSRASAAARSERSPRAPRLLGDISVLQLGSNPLPQRSST